MTTKNIKIENIGTVMVYGEEKKCVTYVAMDEKKNVTHTRKQSFDKTVPESELMNYGKQLLSQLKRREEKAELYRKRQIGEEQMKKDEGLVGLIID